MGSGAAVRLSAPSRATRRSVLAAAAALALVAAGCGPRRPSKLAQGQLVETGDPATDALFVELRDALARTKDVDGEAPLRKQVAVAMGLPADTAGDETIEALSERSKEVKAKGVPISVALSPEPRVGGKVEWADAIEAVLRDGLKRADELAAAAEQLAALEPKRAEALVGIDARLKAAGVPLAKIREAKRELEDAKEVLEERRLLASNESGRAARYTLSVARAVDLTAGSAAPPPPPPAPEKKTPPWARKRPGGSARPPARGGAPPPKPPKKKPAGDDFEP
jgi:hypothetical protein